MANSGLVSGFHGLREITTSAVNRFKEGFITKNAELSIELYRSVKSENNHFFTSRSADICMKTSDATAS